MPHIDVNLYPGRSPELKKDLARKIVDFFSTELKFPVESLSVSFTEIDKDNFSKEIGKKINPDDIVIASGHVK